MKRRITRITVETEREVILSGRNRTREIWCDQCGKSGPGVDTLEAATLLELSPEEAQALLENKSVHLIEAAKGRFLVCLDSLQDHTKRRT